jgi:charged multivesicular body protein 7
MKAYETSTMTLKSLLAHPSLKRDKIEETMEAMAEAAADHAEIDEAIRLGGEGVAAAAGTTIDEEELKKELQEIIETKEREEAEAKEMEMRKRKEQQEMEERKAKEQKEREVRMEKQRREGEQRAQEQKRIPIGAEVTSSIPDGEQQWEERWLAEQAEKMAQAQRNKEAENKIRARWEAEEVHAE